VQATLALAQQAAQDAAEAAATAESVLASGPVSSVNGRTGAVVLGMSDIAGLVSALAAKADSSHGHTIAQVSNLQATLNAISDGGAY
jgi:phosphopantothenate synthetase